LAAYQARIAARFVAFISNLSRRLAELEDLEPLEQVMREEEPAAGRPRSGGAAAVPAGRDPGAGASGADDTGAV